MKTKKEKFLELPFVSKEQTNVLEKNRERIKNRARLRESQQIALKVLAKLDELGWTQRKLAKTMGVTPQQITKIVSGKENLTLETQVKLQEILDIPILATYYENDVKRMVDEIFSKFTVEDYRKYTFQKGTIMPVVKESITTPTVKLDYNNISGNYTHYSIPA